MSDSSNGDQVRDDGGIDKEEEVLGSTKVHRGDPRDIAREGRSDMEDRVPPLR